jgi:hypothetical protein
MSLESRAMGNAIRAAGGRSAQKGEEASADLAILALTELIQSEHARAMMEEPRLAEQANPGRVWLLWFAIGATDAVCRFVEREQESERNDVFRQVVNAIFGEARMRSSVGPIQADRRLIELFESAGAEAVEACMRGDQRLGYYVEALRVGSRLGT